MSELTNNSQKAETQEPPRADTNKKAEMDRSQPSGSGVDGRHVGTRRSEPTAAGARWATSGEQGDVLLASSDRGTSKVDGRSAKTSNERSANQTRESQTTRDAGKKLVGVSKQFKFDEFDKNGRHYQTATGRLGEPGIVVTHRDKKEQSALSRGTGDDASHLIGDRFGPPGDQRNLSLGNWKTNRFGTYKQLEDEWEAKLHRGVDIEVKVTDVTRNDESRPFMRTVQWTETEPDGTRSEHSRTYANTHTDRSREYQDIPETTSGDEKDNVIRGPWEGMSNSWE